MKKILALILILCTLVTLVACKDGAGDNSKDTTKSQSETTKAAETTKANNNDDDDKESESKIKTQGYVLAVSTSTHSDSSYDLPNGMSMFYLLSDGTFLVFDGGQGTANASIDAHHLYKQLRDVADKNGIKKIVVSAWVITHAHQDHYGFGHVFFSTYKKDVQINNFWFNAVSGYSLTNTVRNMITTNYPFAQIRRLTVGERLAVADVLVDVMLTPEALTADNPDAIKDDFNNSSLVLKLTIGGKTVLMTGDASKAAWDWLVEKYPEVNGVSKLKSDILQVPHHGAKTAGTTAGYELVDPDILVYPAGARLYERCVDSSYTSNYQASTATLITRTAKKHGDTTLSAKSLSTLLKKDYFFLAGEYLGTEKDLTATRQCFIIDDED